MNLLTRVLKRIEESNTFFEGRDITHNGRGYTSYKFDDCFTIDYYNSLYRINFKGEVLGHFHSHEKDGFWSINDVIKNKKEGIKQRLLNEF